MVSENKLIHFDTAKRELALASSIDEVKLIRDQAEAIRQYIRQQKGSFEMQNQAAEIKLRAERRAGEMLKDNSDIKPGGDRKSSLHNVRMKLKDLGISEVQSHRWQLEAEIPEEQFEQHIIETKSRGEELTSIGAQRLAARLHKKEYINELITIPTMKYRTIIVDPPWPVKKIEREVAILQQGYDYNTWTLDAIRDLELPADDNCHLYLWTTQKYLKYSFNIIECWGFTYIFTMVWHKSGGFQPFGLPQYNCEFVIFGKKGDIPFLDTKDFFTCFTATRREHSRKPDEFYNIVMRVSPKPIIDYFSREKRNGIDQYG